METHSWYVILVECQPISRRGKPRTCWGRRPGRHNGAQEAAVQGDHEVMRIGWTWVATFPWRRAHLTLKPAGRPRRTADHLELPGERCQHSDVHGEP